MRAIPGRGQRRLFSIQIAIVFTLLAPQTARAVPLTELVAGGTIVVGNVRFSDFVYTSGVVPASLLEIRAATTDEGAGFDILGIPTARESSDTTVDVNFQLLIRASVLEPRFPISGIAMALVVERSRGA